MHTCSSDIIIGTEIWLSDVITDSEFTFPHRFVVFRKDRTGSRGGGVIIVIKQDYQPSLIPIDSPLELVGISATIKSIKCVIGACYRPRDCQNDFVDLLNESLEEVSTKIWNRIIILAGDFNYPDIEWSNLRLNNPYNRAEYLRFLHFTQIHNLNLLVQEPTRGNHILDLILTNHPVNYCGRVLEDISYHKNSLISCYRCHVQIKL